jgi:predicted nucleotidyltransferase component of viral defense system
MAFKGGTVLSKVYNIIERFFEDIDITANELRNKRSRQATGQRMQRPILM